MRDANVYRITLNGSEALKRRQTPFSLSLRANEVSEAISWNVCERASGLPRRPLTFY